MNIHFTGFCQLRPRKLRTGAFTNTVFQPRCRSIFAGSRYSYPSSINGISECTFCPPRSHCGSAINFPFTQTALPLLSHASAGGESVAGERERLLKPIQKSFTASSSLQIWVVAYQVVCPFLVAFSEA